MLFTDAPTDGLLACLDFALDNGIQGTTVRVEYGDAAIAVDVADAHVISQAFPHTYGQPLAHFLRKMANVPDATIIAEHPVVRYTQFPCSFY